MSRLVNLSDSVYQELTRRKKAKGQSYSEAVEELLGSAKKEAKKTDNWDHLIALIKERDRKFRGKREKIDHDQILYGD